MTNQEKYSVPETIALDGGGSISVLHPRLTQLQGPCAAYWAAKHQHVRPL